MNPDKIILSHPFSGALYAFFTEQLSHSPEDSLYHPYYRTLYGENFRELTDLTLTLALLYKNIVIAPADNHVPDLDQYYDGNEYNNPEIGLSLSWGDFRSVYEEIKAKVERDVEDRVIRRVLRKVPPMARRQILMDTRYEMHQAGQHHCPILCLGGRKRIIYRLAELNAEARSVDTVEKASVQMVEEYLDISGLMFNPKTIDALYALKADKDLQSYADAFVSVMHSFRENRGGRKKLLLLIRESLDKANLASKIAGGFDVASTVLDLVGLIPGASPLVSLGELGASGVSGLARRVQRRQEWYQFGPHIHRLQSLDQIEKKIEEELDREVDN